MEMANVSKRQLKMFCKISTLPYTSNQCRIKKNHTVMHTAKLSLKEA